MSAPVGRVCGIELFESKHLIRCTLAEMKVVFDAIIIVLLVLQFQF